ncbi:MAG TPA: hypothetical protein VMD56_06575 [Steroidobacteraceae bacterium]|nr:hypothetical protein [Steroidobacteraceae bacterium]
MTSGAEASGGASGGRLSRYLAAHAFARELLAAALCLLLGLVVMPCLIWALGRASLGPYEHGGVFALWRDFLGGLAGGSEAFWLVLCAPYLLLWLLRGGRRLLHN